MSTSPITPSDGVDPSTDTPDYAEWEALVGGIAPALSDPTLSAMPITGFDALSAAPLAPDPSTPIAVPAASTTLSETISAPAAGSAAPNFWVSEGPAPGINGQENVLPNNQINGAIQAIAVNPTDPNIMYVGSVNGGIWKTMNATAASPHWTPLIDNLPSLSIGALEFDPTDSTHQTLIAGLGATSSFGAVHGSSSGVLRTTDGGATWSQLGTTALAGDNFTSVAARGTTLLAAAESNWGFSLVNGLFRSTDSGANWTLISDGAHGLPNATSVSDLVGDPLQSNVLYAAVTGANGGVFKSTDTGATWSNITSGIGIVNSTTAKIKLAVHHDATNVAVFATVDNFSATVNDDTLSGVFQSVNGGSFVALDVPSGGTQGNLHGTIAADPNNPNIAYVGLGGGSANYLTRIDASKPSGSQITKISGGSFGSPHVDTRDMQIDANGNLILSSDGGLFRLPTPTANTGVWSAIVGDMSVFEFHDIAYDDVSHVIMGGSQDNGTLVQHAPGSATWDHPGFGDGGDVVIDNVSRAASGQSIRYFSSQNLGGWERQVYDSANNLVSTTFLASIADAQFSTPVALNNVDPTRLLVGGSGHIYQSLNQGTSLTAIATAVVNWFVGGGMMVYGGVQNSIADPDLIYAASGQNVLKQTTAGGGFTTTSPGGGYIYGVTDNPTNWATVFAIDHNQVFESTNAGATWADVTGNLTSISVPDFHSIDYVHGAVDDALVVGTSSGVFDAKVSGLGGSVSWSKFGGNLPDAITYDLAYDAKDNVLVAGTMGRGAWLVNNATTNLGIDAPPPPSGLALSAASDSGIKGDNITDVKTPVITGFGVAGDKVTLAQGAILLGSATVAANGTWSITTFPLTLGPHSLTATETDGSNVSAASAPLSLNIVQSPATSDVNGDNMSDIVFQATNGLVGIWEINGVNIIGTGSPSNPGPSWHAIATGDFNSDGFSDIVLQNDAGPVGVWEMKDVSVIATGGVADPGPTWHPIATGDFDGDGKSDIVLQNNDGTVAVWEMNGLKQGPSGVVSDPGPSWHVIGTGDFDGNGMSDILLQNSDGTVGVWLMNGTTMVGSGVVQNPGTSWHAVGTGDFDGNGKGDILLQNTDGTVGIWFMNGTNMIGSGVVADPGPSWHAIGAGDYNGDGKSDILLQNSDGAVGIWLMDGTTMIGAGIPQMNWHLLT